MTTRSERGLDEVGVVRAGSGASLGLADAGGLALPRLGSGRRDVLTVRLLKNATTTSTRSTQILSLHHASRSPTCLSFST